MTNKTLDTLIADIHGLFEVDHTINEDNLKAFADNIAESVKNRLEAIQTWDNPTLRVSKLGTPNRKMWYEMNRTQENENSTIDAATCLKFMYGDIVEELLLLMIKEAGHKVEGEQGEIEIDGVVGHRDCKIDGITVDIKSASSYGFKKFKDGTLHQDDPFGYIAQISTYCKADNSPYGAFLAMNKENGELTLLNIDPIDMINPSHRIAELREVIEQDTPPEEKCYAPKPFGKTGNMTLATGCNYCPFKEMCWSGANGGNGLRKFRYSNGIKYLTEVVNEPRVEEVFDSN